MVDAGSLNKLLVERVFAVVCDFQLATRAFENLQFVADTHTFLLVHDPPVEARYNLHFHVDHFNQPIVLQLRVLASQEFIHTVVPVFALHVYHMPTSHFRFFLLYIIEVHMDSFRRFPLTGYDLEEYEGNNSHPQHACHIQLMNDRLGRYFRLTNMPILTNTVDSGSKVVSFSLLDTLSALLWDDIGIEGTRTISISLTRKLTIPQISMTEIEQANHFKNLGNEAFKAQKFTEAVELFTKAIELNPNDHVFFSNRSGAHINTGDYELALKDAEHCVKLNSQWPRGYQRKGTAYFYLEKFDEAIETYKEGLKIDPNNAALQEDLKSAQKRKNEGAAPEGAFNEQYLSMMIKLMSNPETKEFFNDPEFMKKAQMCMQNPQLASMLVQNDPKLKKAMEVLQNDTNPNDLESLKKMFEKNSFAKQPQQQSKPEPKKQQKPPQKKEPEDPAEALKNKGNQQFQKRNFNQALNYYEQAITVNPNEPLFYNNKAAAYIELKDFDSALEEIAKAEKLFEENVVNNYSKKAKVLARKASIFAKLDKLDESIQAYEQSLLEDQNQKVKDELLKVKKLKKENQARAYIDPVIAEQNCEAGNALYKEGKFPAALKEYEEAIRRNPEVAKYYSNLGTVEVKLMQFQRAKENFEIALKKDPSYTRVYPKKGDCHFFLKEYHKALEAYELGLKHDPENQLCKQGIQKTQAAIYSSGNEQDQQERAKKAMADPEIQAILQTPEIRNALSELQRDPKSLQNILKNKSIAEKLQKLIAAGVLRIG